MTTKRKRTAATGRQGVNYTRAVVENGNCIFQAIDAENDLGHDAYIEFISNEEATSFVVWVQIKSGTSYRRKSGDYFLPADKDHFEYWNEFPAPVVGIVYDPDCQSAVWVNISEHLRSNPDVIRSGPFTLSVPAENEFNDRMFADFAQQMSSFNYRSDLYFGRCLEYLAATADQERCLAGIRSLFAYHRSRKSTWFYLINSFRSIEGFALFPLTEILSLLPGNPFIFWHRGNRIDQDVEEYGKDLLASTFGRNEVLKLIDMVDDYGFTAGSFGYIVSTLVFLVAEVKPILEDIAFDDALSEEQRGRAIVLLVHHEQFHSKDYCLGVIARFSDRLTDAEDVDWFKGMKEMLERDGFLGYIGT